MQEFDSTNKKVKAFFICIISYALAFIISIITGAIFNFLHPLMMILFADLAATIVIFIISTILKNTSLYDPYWSVAPLVITLYYLIFPQISGVDSYRYIIVFILVFIWSIRLTYNWLRQWRGLKHEDWRYTMYRIKKGKKFWLTNLIGLHLMPTLQVYLGSISLYPALSLRTKPIWIIDIVAIFITITAITIETLADQQLNNFIKNRESHKEIMTTGLWAYSRHPNYFGEILFWWGLYVFALAADLTYYWAIIGPISITVLFYILSIPIMERRNFERKPDYMIYKEQVSKLIPWFPRKKLKNNIQS
jgi:steroid 5-alpha reductase family enzyme